MGSSRLRDRSWVSWTVGRFFTVWATREVQYIKTLTRIHILGLNSYISGKLYKNNLIKRKQLFENKDACFHVIDIGKLELLICPPISSVQFSSITQLFPILCDLMDCHTPGLPVYHQLPWVTQTQVHWVGDAIQPSHSLSSPSSLAFNVSQHQGLFKLVSSSHQVAKVLEFQLQHQSFQWIFRVDFL